jgi:hypothetical protein
VNSSAGHVSEVMLIGPRIVLGPATGFLPHPVQPADLRRCGFATAIVGIPTVLDYALSWSFYWPYSEAADE